jgi:hypothetical protein
MDPLFHPEDGCTLRPPYLGHAIPSPSLWGWTGTEASVLSRGDGNRMPSPLGWRSGSIPASIPSLWDGEWSPSPPPSLRLPSLSDGMETGHHSHEHSLGTEGDGVMACSIPSRSMRECGLYIACYVGSRRSVRTHCGCRTEPLRVAAPRRRPRNTCACARTCARACVRGTAV